MKYQADKGQRMKVTRLCTTHVLVSHSKDMGPYGIYRYDFSFSWRKTEADVVSNYKAVLGVKIRFFITRGLLLFILYWINYTITFFCSLVLVYLYRNYVYMNHVIDAKIKAIRPKRKCRY